MAGPMDVEDYASWAGLPQNITAAGPITHLVGYVETIMPVVQLGAGRAGLGVIIAGPKSLRRVNNKIMLFVYGADHQKVDHDVLPGRAYKFEFTASESAALWTPEEDKATALCVRKRSAHFNETDHTHEVTWRTTPGMTLTYTVLDCKAHAGLYDVDPPCTKKLLDVTKDDSISVTACVHNITRGTTKDQREFLTLELYDNTNTKMLATIYPAAMDLNNLKSLKRGEVISLRGVVGRVTNGGGEVVYKLETLDTSLVLRISDDEMWSETDPYHMNMLFKHMKDYSYDHTSFAKVTNLDNLRGLSAPMNAEPETFHFCAATCMGVGSIGDQVVSFNCERGGQYSKDAIYHAVQMDTVHTTDLGFQVGHCGACNSTRSVVVKHRAMAMLRDADGLSMHVQITDQAGVSLLGQKAADAYAHNKGRSMATILQQYATALVGHPIVVFIKATQDPRSKTKKYMLIAATKLPRPGQTGNKNAGGPHATPPVAPDTPTPKRKRTI